MSQTKAQLIDNLVQALSFTGTSTAPANGLFLSATNTLALSTNSAERLKIDGTEIVFNDIGSNIDFRVEGDTEANLLFVDASADKVGIGTNSPGALLHLQAATPVIRFTDSDTSRDSQIVGIDGNLRFDADNNDAQSGTNISFKTDNVERLKIDGTEVVVNDTGASVDSRAEGDTEANLLFVDASADKVGTGTSSPAFKLHVNGTSRFGSTRINSTTESTDGAFNDLVIGDYSSNRGISILSGATGQGAVGFAKSGTTADGYLAYVHNGTATSSAMTLKSQGHIKFNAGSSTKLYIEHDGNVGIGTTSPAVRLEVEDTISAAFNADNSIAAANQLLKLENLGSDSFRWHALSYFWWR